MIATDALASVTRRAYWTVDQALSWMHEGSEPDALMFAGPHRSAENFGRLLDVLKQGRIVASTLEPNGQRRDLRPDEWMDLELWEDDRPSMFVGFDFAIDGCDPDPTAPIFVRTRSVVHRSRRAGPCVPSAAEISSEPGSVQWFHVLRDHVLFPAEQVRACFPPRSVVSVQVSEGKNKGGRPPVYLWDQIVDQFMLDIGRLGSYVDFMKIIREISGKIRSELPDDHVICYHFRNTFPKYMSSIASLLNAQFEIGRDSDEKYNWDEIIDLFLIELGALDTQADLIRCVEEAAGKIDARVPSERQIRSYFGKRFPKFVAASKEVPR